MTDFFAKKSVNGGDYSTPIPVRVSNRVLPTCSADSSLASSIIEKEKVDAVRKRFLHELNEINE